MANTEDLFHQVYEDCKAEDIKDWNTEGFIEYCEHRYQMTTKEFHQWFIEHHYEGNVDHQLWFQITKEIK